MICLIVAHARNRVIGKDGKMPWHIPQELKHFREVTMGGAVVMGRRTYESIGRPLPGRLNIVVSSTMKYTGENLLTADSLPQAIELAGDRDVFISGGRRLYREALDIVDIMYITEIDADVEGDTYFPEFDAEKFERKVDGEFTYPVTYRYVTYTRKK
ncbi:MAG: dihydrofolate reductase [Oscillospiraceae bacterium]|nr:dihydrofolate reductase [Oscillospiraceae bacterium]